MLELKQYLNELDNSSIDYKDHSQIKERFSKIAEELKDKDDDNLEKQQTRWEYEVLNVNASIQRGLEPVFEREGKNEAGDIVKVEWPDLKLYGEKEFTYLKNRYSQTKNIYLKSKYGLVLLLTKQKADNQFVLELIDTLLKLSEVYLGKKSEHNHYILYFAYSLKDAFYLAQKRKSANEIGEKYKLILKFIYETLLKLGADEKEGKFIISSLTNLVIHNYNDFSTGFNISAISEMNWKIANETQKEDKHGAIDISSINLKLDNLLKADITKWHRLIAESYVKLAEERGGMSAPEFYISAIRHYKIIQDTAKMNELHLLLSEAKTKMDFGKFEYTLPSEDVKKLNDEIQKEIELNNSEFILARLAHSVYLPRFSHVKEQTKKNGFTTAQIISTAFYDKHGNKTLAVNPQNSDEDVSFYSSYDLHFQIPSQIYAKYFFDAIKANKISFDLLNNWLNEKTWYGEKILRVYNGYTNEISILELLTPVLKLLFEDFTKALTVENYTPNYVCILDSITLKVEYIIRMLCDEKLNISTAYVNSDGTVDEKTFTALVFDLKKFVKDHPSIKPDMKQVLLDDIIFIDFILNSKAGKNIRNRVAHAHLDVNEYTSMKIVLVLAVILKLSLFKTETPLLLPFNK